MVVLFRTLRTRLKLCQFAHCTKFKTGICLTIFGKVSILVYRDQKKKFAKMIIRSAANTPK